MALLTLHARAQRVLKGVDARLRRATDARKRADVAGIHISGSTSQGQTRYAGVTMQQDISQRHVSKPSMLRRLYDWCVAAAGKPYATWLLGIVSFVESSFFHVPPDAMLIPMGLAPPDRAFSYALVCTLTSVAGGLSGG